MSSVKVILKVPFPLILIHAEPVTFFQDFFLTLKKAWGNSKAEVNNTILL